MYYIVRLVKYVTFDNNFSASYWLMTKEERLAYKRFLREDQKASDLNKKVKRSMVLTLISWVVGAILLATTTIIMDKYGLLINHKKGIHKRVR